MRKNEVLTLAVEDQTNLGFGVAHEGGMAIFIENAVKGDSVLAKVIKVNKTYAVARLEKLLVPSPLRAEGRCPNPACRACAYKQIAYGAELELKRQTVASLFKKEGLSDMEILPVTSTGATANYRNKAEYPVAREKDGGYRIGFYAPKSHRVTEAANCPLAPAIFGEILDTLRHFFRKYDLSCYDEESGRGLLRHIYLRRGEVSGEILLTLVVTEGKFPHADELVAEVTKRFPAVVGILLNINSKDTNVILGEKYLTLFGRDHIFDTLAGVRLKLAAPAFYQVNHDAAELLYAKAKELANPGKLDTVLDLYCGAGSIGLSMAKDCRRVVGVEIVPEAIACAKENARENGIANAHFFIGDAKDTERLLESAEAELGKIKPNIILLDPPRGGCDEELLSFVAKLSPERLVYISCGPATLARDLARLRTLGYAGTTVYPFDLFPGTGHVENVALLSKAAVLRKRDVFSM